MPWKISFGRVTQLQGANDPDHSIYALKPHRFKPISVVTFTLLGVPRDGCFEPTT